MHTTVHVYMVHIWITIWLDFECNKLKQSISLHEWFGMSTMGTEKIDFDANSLLGKKIRREFQINTKSKFRSVESLSNVTHFIFVSFTLFIDKYIVNQSTDNVKYCTISIIKAKHTTSTATEQEKRNKNPTKETK